MTGLLEQHIKTQKLSNDTWGIAQAIHLLRTGSVVALPTETVYGLAANAFSPDAVNKIFMAKGRPKNNPLILHVDNLEKAHQLFNLKDPQAKERLECLAKKFWPGPLTIVAEKNPCIPDAACAGLPTVGVRIPNHQDTLRVLQELDFPLAMPSANISTRPSPTSVEHVLLTLDGSIDAVLDGSFCGVGIESTIIRIDSKQPIILRPGMITLDALEQCLNETVVNESPKQDAIPLAPGSAYVHYAPKVASVLLIDMDNAHAHWSSRDTIMCRHSEYEMLATRWGGRPQDRLSLILSDNPQQYAQELYQALYNSEQQAAEQNLIIIKPPKDKDWSGIFDRIRRSAQLLPNPN